MEVYFKIWLRQKYIEVASSCTRFSFLAVTYLLYGLSDLAFLTSLSPLYQLRSVPPVTRTRSISAANTANLLNRNAWRPNCFSFEALRPSPRSQMGPCPPLSLLHFLLFATRAILRSIPFSTTSKMREYDAPVSSICPSVLFKFVWRVILYPSKCVLQ